jgi:hypothetical protein
MINQTEIAQPGLGSKTHKRLYLVNVIGFEILTILLVISKKRSIKDRTNRSVLLLLSLLFLKVNVKKKSIKYK